MVCFSQHNYVFAINQLPLSKKNPAKNADDVFVKYIVSSDFLKILPSRQMMVIILIYLAMFIGPYIMSVNVDGYNRYT